MISQNSPHIKSGQLLSVALVGLPGAGKSTFARALCRRIGARRVNGDDIKVEMFGSLAQANNKADGQHEQRHRQTYVEASARIKAILKQGCHLVCDWQHNELTARQKARQLAANHGAYHVIAWLNIDPLLSIARALARCKPPSNPGVPIWNLDQAYQATIRTLAKIEPPKSDENIVFIDANKPTDHQIDTLLNQINWPKL